MGAVDCKSPTWDFIIVEDPSTRSRVAEVAPFGKFITDAPVMIATLVNPKIDPVHYVEDDAIIITHASLSVHTLFRYLLGGDFWLNL